MLDESKLVGDIPNIVYLPKTTKEVIHAIIAIAKKNETVTVSGARTGVVGGAVPQGCKNIISTENISFISDLNYNKEHGCWTIKVGAGTRLEELLNFLDNKKNFQHLESSGRLSYPVDPTEISATIGGNVSTNASGSRSYFFGSTREWVYGLEIVLSDGSLLNLNRNHQKTINGKFFFKNSAGSLKEIILPNIEMPKTKNSAGYFCREDMDAIDLFIGSEGTLGIITEVELKLFELKENYFNAILFIPDHDFLNVVNDFKSSSNLNIVAIEFMDKRSVELLKICKKEGITKIPKIPNKTESILFLEGFFPSDNENMYYEEFERVLNKNNLRDITTWVALNKADKIKMKDFRRSLPEQINSIVAERKLVHPKLTKIATDIAVPESKLSDLIGIYESLLEANGLEFYIFGHIGDNHLHVNMLPNSMEEYDLAWKLYKEISMEAVKMKGSVAAEHGIGKIKKPFLYLQYSDKNIEEMKTIKKQFDPGGILNPGVLF
jgi:D-lactate dehydrogenase (cytochrome)